MPNQESNPSDNTFKQDSMLSDKEFEDNDYDKLLHPKAVEEAINSDGGYGIFEASMDRDDKNKVQCNQRIAKTGQFGDFRTQNNASGM